MIYQYDLPRELGVGHLDGLELFIILGPEPNPEPLNVLRGRVPSDLDQDI